jgi:hypothetical protein
LGASKTVACTPQFRRNLCRSPSDDVEIFDSETGELLTA